MSEQALKKLVGALVIAVALWGVTSLFTGGGSGARTASGEMAGVLDGIAEGSVDAVRMTTLVGTTELTRGAGGWLVNGFRSDSGSVAGFWRVVSSARVGDLVATNPANHGRMGVSDDAAWELEFDLTDETRALLIGAQGPRFGTAYVRLPGSDEVYLFEGDVRSHVQRQLEQWRNKRMASIDTSAVVRLDIERDGDAFALVRGDTTWTFDSGESVRDGVLRNLLTDLRAANASGILAADDSLATAAQAGSIVAHDAGGGVLAELSIGAGDGDRWARVTGDETLYRLPSFRVDRLFPTREAALPQSTSNEIP